MRMNGKQPTVLTNLQRGNVKQESPMILHQRTIFELAAQGELYHIESHMMNITDANGLTPLLWAAGYGQNTTVDFLIRAGANPNHRAVGGATALMLAASRGFFYVVRTLIADGAYINDVDDRGNTALMYAAHQNHGLIIRELVRNGANLSLTNADGQTAYSIALSRGNEAAQASIETHMTSMLKGIGNSNYTHNNSDGRDMGATRQQNPIG